MPGDCDHVAAVAVVVVTTVVNSSAEVAGPVTLRSGRTPATACRQPPSAVGVFRVPRGCVDDPDGAAPLIDHVPHTPATGDLVLPLFEVAAVVPMCCEIPTKTMLPVVIGPGTRLASQGFQASPCVRQRETAQLLPASYRLAAAEPDVPLSSGGGTVTLSPRLGLKA